MDSTVRKSRGIKSAVGSLTRFGIRDRSNERRVGRELLNSGLDPFGSFELAPEQTCEALARLPFLSSATPAQIDRLAQGVRSIRYGKGEILFRQNDPGDELFLISSGTLDIFVVNGRKVEEKIASVGVGSFVGERSLLTVNRGASPRARLEIAVCS